MKVRTLKPVLLAQGLTAEGQELSLEGVELESCLKHGLVEPVGAREGHEAPPPLAKPQMPPNIVVGGKKKF